MGQSCETKKRWGVTGSPFYGHPMTKCLEGTEKNTMEEIQMSISVNIDIPTKTFQVYHENRSRNPKYKGIGELKGTVDGLSLNHMKMPSLYTDETT